jgi:NAD-dependent deacetylase
MDAIHADSVKALRTFLAAARRAIVFTGAGISTESGIPDFRSPGGLWSKYRPIDFQEFLSSEEARREYWRRKVETDKVLLKAEPNRGHRAVARLVREGKASSVITQNIDGLHQAAGVPEERVIELHGNTTYATCLECGERYELDPIKAAFQEKGLLPECGACLGIVKPATIAFGQAMPELAMRRAEEETMAADLCVVLGSSLVVYPAAGFPVMAKQNGARLVIVNREPTPLDDYADIVVHASIGPVLGEAVGVN